MTLSDLSVPLYLPAETVQLILRDHLSFAI